MTTLDANNEWNIRIGRKNAAAGDINYVQVDLIDDQAGSILAGFGVLTNGSRAWRAGVWHNIVVTYNGSKGSHGDISSSGVKVYIDGEDIASLQDMYVVSSYTAMHNTSANLAIGNLDTEHATRDFPGSIAEVAIWKDAVLTNENANAIYYGGLNGFRQDYGKSIKGFLSSSRNSISEIGTRFKSSTCGLIYGESNSLGTDSIAFGGLKK